MRDEDRPREQPYGLLYRDGASTEQLRAMTKPATKLEIARCLALLLKSFPNAGNADAEVYGGMLIEDVAANKPTIGDLEETCRHIRRTSRFLPTIAEVLETLTEAEHQRMVFVRSIGTPTQSIARPEQPAGYLAYQQTIACAPIEVSDPTAVPF